VEYVKTDRHGLKQYRIVDKSNSHTKKVRWQLMGISDTNEEKSRTIARAYQIVFDKRFGQQQFVVRRLQPEEVEKLFTFPVGWTKDLARTTRLGLLGNAVVVKAIQFVTDAFKTQF
jgi:hypothetical protein